jgi:anti-anti-sigma regulatory factor
LKKNIERSAVGRDQARAHRGSAATTAVREPVNPDMGIRARLSDQEISGLAAGVLAKLMNGGGPSIICDASVIIHPSAETVDALARLQLNARRLGGHVVLRNASTELRELIGLAGLDEVLKLED